MNGGNGRLDYAAEQLFYQLNYPRNDYPEVPRFLSRDYQKTLHRFQLFDWLQEQQNPKSPPHLNA